MSDGKIDVYSRYGYGDAVITLYRMLCLHWGCRNDAVQSLEKLAERAKKKSHKKAAENVVGKAVKKPSKKKGVVAVGGHGDGSDDSDFEEE